MDVFEKGNIMANVLLLGEGPGETEDRYGIPFIGKSGKLLDGILEAVGLTYADVLFANVVQRRLPGNDTPDIDMIRRHLPRLSCLLELVRPSVVVCLGQTAANAMRLLSGQIGERIGKLSGTSESVTIGMDDGSLSPGHTLTIIYTYHPAAALPYRDPAKEKHIMRTFSAHRELLESVIGRRIFEK